MLHHTCLNSQQHNSRLPLQAYPSCVTTATSILSFPPRSASRIPPEMGAPTLTSHLIVPLTSRHWMFPDSSPTMMSVTPSLSTSPTATYIRTKMERSPENECTGNQRADNTVMQSMRSWIKLRLCIKRTRMQCQLQYRTAGNFHGRKFLHKS